MLRDFAQPSFHGQVTASVDGGALSWRHAGRSGPRLRLAASRQRKQDALGHDRKQSRLSHAHFSVLTSASAPPALPFRFYCTHVTTPARKMRKPGARRCAECNSSRLRGKPLPCPAPVEVVCFSRFPTGCVIVARDGPGGPSSFLQPRVAKAAHDRVPPGEPLAILLDSLLRFINAAAPRGDVAQVGQKSNRGLMLFVGRRR